MSFYQYQPLSSPSTQIRLLELLPGRGKIKCRLTTVVLNDAQDAYEPISYCWQKHEKARKNESRCIIVDGAELLIMENLDDALKQIRLNDEVRRVWADAICINQNDATEKNVQIPLMAQIYGGGQRTLVWLGKADRWTGVAFRILRRNLKRCQPVTQRSDTYDSATQDSDTQESDTDDSDIEDFDTRSTTIVTKGLMPWLRDVQHVHVLKSVVVWKAMTSIFTRAYFRRTWIIQEIILSANVLVLCGKHSMDWDDIFNGRPSDVPAVGEDVVLNLDGIWTAFGGTELTLVRAMAVSSRSHATMPQDKLYSILGLIPDHLRETHIQVDYDKDCQSVFYDFTKGTLLARSNLDVLCMASGTSPQVGSQHRAVPSWVWNPNVSDPHDRFSLAPFGLFGDLGFEATRYSESRVTFNDRMLGLNGYTIDRIAKLSSVYKGERIESVKDRLRGIGNAWGRVQQFLECRTFAGLDDTSPDAVVMEQRRKVFAHTLAPYKYQDTSGGSSMQVETIWRESAAPRDALLEFNEYDELMIRRFGKHNLESKKTLGLLKNAWASIVFWMMECSHLKPENTLNHEDRVFRRFTYTQGLADRRLFKTDTGLMGLCPKETQQGDQLALLQGGKVPFVLRPAGDHWALVGECYVYEIMDGQAWDESRCEVLWIE